jgi:hypothetical protein
MQRLRNSIDLAKSSWSVLSADRELIALPFISLAATALIAASFFGPAAWLAATDGFGPLSAVLALLGYFALSFTAIFFNAALVSAADERMRGGDPSLSSAIEGARRRAGKILPWALLSASVSLVLRALEQRAGVVGRIVVGLIGLAWSLVTFLVLPILVIEGIGVRDAVTRSSQLFRKAWGEQVITNGGIGLVSMLALLPGVLVGALGIASGTPIVLVPLVVVAALWVLTVLCVTSALSGVFQTALYHYAANGMPPAAFQQAHLERAFVPKRS